MNDYIPSTTKWVAEQVELYESSNGEEGTTLRGLPVIIVTNTGRITGSIRKTPLMRVSDGNKYVLVASQGGSEKNPYWYYNLKADPRVMIRDRSDVYEMVVREVEDVEQRSRLWSLAVQAYPPYEDYQSKTTRIIPVFLAEVNSR
ncbi:MAG: nitroreductase family deazaflavin-dependent oxidoreductase [SAR202 cluster bacterium]|nr:nitroreductase family deazaflavin-dependent oxidoreductase [SAR202 cluster bacterium]|tara:strand:+ start:439 stop:873 length:435 start_codon:yes stop_codon:yes gene_type:complete